MSLRIDNYTVQVADKEILHGVCLDISPGELHAIMGPNGSGKSTLAGALMGHPKYRVLDGTVILDGINITGLSPSDRAERGLFLSMQHVPEIEGVTVSNFIRTCLNAKRDEKLHPVTFHRSLKKKMEELGMDPSFASRSLNVGFSGGEKKRLEIIQLEMLDPTYVILDETDSGLDVDALKLVAEGIKRFASNGNKGIIVITHYPKLLSYLEPSHVHVMKDGRTVRSGGTELILEIETQGFAE